MGHYEENLPKVSPESREDHRNIFNEHFGAQDSKIIDTLYSVRNKLTKKYINTGGDSRNPPSYGSKEWAERLCRQNSEFEVVKFYVTEVE